MQLAGLATAWAAKEIMEWIAVVRTYDSQEVNSLLVNGFVFFGLEEVGSNQAREVENTCLRFLDGPIFLKKLAKTKF